MEIFGKNAVREYLRRQENPAGVLYIAREGRRQDSREIESLAREKGITVKRIPRQALDRRLPGAAHQGLLLAEESGPSPEARKGSWKEELTEAVERGEGPVVAVLDRVQDPQNLGAIIRSAALFGISAVFIPTRNAASFTMTARKAACGGEQIVPVIEVPNLSNLLEDLKKMGFWIAASVMDGDRSLWELDTTGPFAVVMGSEGEGVRRLLQEKCDYRLAIPTNGRLDSLNVSVASALVFHETFRQRSLKGK